MTDAAGRNRFMRLSIAALASLVFFLPGTTHAQQKLWNSANWQLTIDGLGDVSVRVLTPRNVAELAENGTLRRVELAIGRGPISDALHSAASQNKRIEQLDLKAEVRGSATLIIRMHDVLVTPISSSGGDLPIEQMSLNFSKVESKYYEEFR